MAELPSWWERVDRIMNQAGVPTRVWASIAYPESSFVPWAKNTADPHGGSYGLFALNLGGQGRGFPVPYLLDPINNAMIAAPHIGDAVKRCGPNNIVCIAAWSGHPVETGVPPPGNRLIASIKRMYEYASGLNSQQIYDTFTSGHGIPSDPGTDPGLFDVPGQIGAGIVSAFGQAIGSLFTAWDLAQIDTKGPPVMAIVGVMLISWGITIAALKGPVGKAAVAVAPIPAPARIAASTLGGTATPPQRVSVPASPMKVRPYRPARQAVPSRRAGRVRP